MTYAWSDYWQSYARRCGKCGKDYPVDDFRRHELACRPRQETVPEPVANALVDELRALQNGRTQQRPSVFCSRCGGDGGATGNCPRCGGNGLEPNA